MNTPHHELDDLITALREDMPSDADQQRMRTRLTAAGAALGTAIIAHQVATQAASLQGTTTLAAKLGAAFTKSAALVESTVQSAGLTLNVASWGLGAKSAIAVTAVAVAATVPVVEHMRAVDTNSPAQGNVPSVEQASPATEVPQVLPQASSTSMRVAATSERPEAVSQTQPLVEVRRNAKALAPQTVGGSDQAPAPESLSVESAAKVKPNVAPLEPTIAPPLKAKQVAATLTDPAQQASPQLGAEPRAERSVAQARETAVAPVDKQAEEPRPSVQPQERSDVGSTPTLQAETQLLEQALTALGQADYSQASRWLDEHRLRFPEGLLAPERLRLRHRIANSALKASQR